MLKVYFDNFIMSSSAIKFLKIRKMLLFATIIFVLFYFKLSLYSYLIQN